MTRDDTWLRKYLIWFLRSYDEPPALSLPGIDHAVCVHDERRMRHPIYKTSRSRNRRLHSLSALEIWWERVAKPESDSGWITSTRVRGAKLISRLEKKTAKHQTCLLLSLGSLSSHKLHSDWHVWQQKPPAMNTTWLSCYIYSAIFLFTCSTFPSIPCLVSPYPSSLWSQCIQDSHPTLPKSCSGLRQMSHAPRENSCLMISLVRDACFIRSAGAFHPCLTETETCLLVTHSHKVLVKDCTVNLTRKREQEIPQPMLQHDLCPFSFDGAFSCPADHRLG
jgi:hypothetical protein